MRDWKERIAFCMLLLFIIMMTGCSETGDLTDDSAEKLSESPISMSEEMTVEGDMSMGTNAEEMEDSTEDSGQDSAENPEQTEMAVLSDEELLRVQKAIEDYYTVVNRTIVSYVQADADSPFLQEYEGYETDEIVMYEVTIANSEGQRYITIGSKDGWNTCDVLNEGY